MGTAYLPSGFIGKVPAHFYPTEAQLQTDQPTRAGNSKRLTVLSQAERTALYGVPDFDDFQRADFFAMTEAERALADRRKGPVERLHCLLQIGYFKAKQAFFNFDAQDVSAEDIEFLVKRYFPRETVALRPLRQDERYTQRTEIGKLFGYQLWSATDRPGLIEMAALLARRDVKPTFILVEVLGFLKARKIVRPGYTTLQTIISDVLSPSAGVWYASSKRAWMPAHVRRCRNSWFAKARCRNWRRSSKMPNISVIR